MASQRFGIFTMAEETKRNRWIPRIALIFFALVLLGAGIAPAIGPLLGGSNATSPPSTGASPDAQKTELERTLQGYEAVLQREPENPNALRGVIEVKGKLGDVKGTIAPLEKLVKANPNVPDYAVVLAQAKQYLKDDEGAIQVYRDALTAKPADLQILGALSQLLVKQDRPQAAIGLLQDTLRDAPKFNQANPGSVDTVAISVLLGRTFANQKRYDESYRVLDTAIKEKPDNFQAYLAKALALKEQGKASEAKPLFEKATSLAPAELKDRIGLLSASPSPSPATAKSEPAKPEPAKSSETPKAAEGQKPDGVKKE